MHITESTEVTDELVEALDRLVPQLSSSASPSREDVAELVASPNTVLFVAREADTIVGMLTLVLYRTPTGLRARIEDVVVDTAARRRGVGTALSKAALQRAADAGARTVDLTSRPSRTAANRLYQKLGFVQRDTNVYRYRPGS